ncbi:MAG: MBL fold metallo-hydrolase [Deltaproteobacteria bacterium]|nr:MBL fold metallo-hydrolase [Deltaproteobacteria bacterium]
MKIIDDLWQVGGEGLTAPGDAAVYLVRFGQQAALIDAGCGPGHQQLVKNVSDCMPPGTEVAWLLLTHCHFDHTGGAAAVRDHYGCRIAAHAEDALYLDAGDSAVTAATWYGASMAPLPVDHKITSKREAIPVGSGELIAHHCPGHSPGSLVYTARLGGQTVLFGQDVHGPLHPSLLSDRDQYRNSLAFLLGLEADILCEGHFGVFKGRVAVKNFIRRYIYEADSRF